MPYYADLDPANAVDLKSFTEQEGELHEHWHENDQDEVIRIMADWLTGLQDQYAKEKLVRMFTARAQSIADRAEESRQVGAPE